MLEALRDNLSGFFVDGIVVLVALVIFYLSKSKASKIFLIANLFIFVVVYLFLIHISFWAVFITDFHLYFTLVSWLLFAAFAAMTKGYYFLKLAYLLEALLHGGLVLIGTAHLSDWISNEVYYAIYYSYPYARLILLSIQITDLVACDGNRIFKQLRSIYSRVRDRVRDNSRYFHLPAKSKWEN